MVQMLFAFVAIGLMFVANILLTVARRRQKGWVRRLMSVSAFLMLPFIFLFAAAAIL